LTDRGGYNDDSAFIEEALRGKQILTARPNIAKQMQY